MKNRKIKKIGLVACVLGFLLVGFALLADYQIKQQTSQYVYSDISGLPYNRVGLLLGTSKHTSSGRENWYFKNRITATKELFQNHKIDFLIISGDNSRQNYNEPRDMKEALVKEGIDSTRIFLDFAGFRTFDSIVRAKKVFGQSKVTIISQQFHNERAVFIARKVGMQAVGYNAQDVRYFGGLKTKVREKFARLLAVTDMFIGTEPKFLGKTIVIK
jgi:SanA protein